MKEDEGSISLLPVRHTPYFLGSNSDVAEVETESRSLMSEVILKWGLSVGVWGPTRCLGALPKTLTGTTGVH
jgi:hypothetical protein